MNVKFIRYSGHRCHTSRGYVYVFAPLHPRANSQGYVPEHVMVASNAMGKPVPRRCQVHHINGIRTDNRPRNLVICEDAAYHKLLHSRQHALQEGGNANFKKCMICRQWGCPTEMKKIGTTKVRFRHTSCYRLSEHGRKYVGNMSPVVHATNGAAANATDANESERRVS